MANQISDQNFARKVWIAGGILSLLIIFLLVAKTIFNLLLLVLAAVIMAIYFLALAGLIQKYLKIPAPWDRVVSILFTLLLLVGFFWFVGARLQQQVVQLSDTLPKTIEQAKEKINSTQAGSFILNHLNNSGSSQKTMALAKKFFSSGFGILSDLYIILLMGLFFTASPSLYKNGIVKLLPAKARDKGEEILNSIGENLKKWLKGMIFGLFFIGVLTGIGLAIAGMPLVLTLALIAGLMNFIPNFGPIIALLPAVLLAMTEGSSMVIIIIVMYSTIQIIQSAVSKPLIQQKMISIPPALVIIGQVAMGVLAGFWGVLLATPVIAIIMTLVNKLYLKEDA